MTALEGEDLGDRVSVLEDANLDQRVTAIEALDLANRLDTHQVGLAALDDSVETILADLLDHSFTIDANTSGRADNSADIAALQVTLGDLASQTSLMDADLSAVESEAALLGANLAALEDEVDANVPVHTTLSYSNYVSLGTSSTFVEFRSLGTFIKQDSATDIRLVWLSHAGGSGQTNSSCNFQPRVDGSADSNGYGAVVTANGESFPVTVVQTYSGLAAGPHSVTLWARNTSVWGGTCFDNAGNYGRKVYIEEGPAN